MTTMSPISNPDSCVDKATDCVFRATRILRRATRHKIRHDLPKGWSCIWARKSGLWTKLQRFELNHWWSCNKLITASRSMLAGMTALLSIRRRGGWHPFNIDSTKGVRTSAASCIIPSSCCLIKWHNIFWSVFNVDWYLVLSMIYTWSSATRPTCDWVNHCDLTMAQGVRCPRQIPRQVYTRF